MAKVNPDQEVADEIVRLHWEEGLSKRMAVIECDHYAPSTSKQNWKKIWAKKPNGNYAIDEIGQAMRKYKNRVKPYVREQIPELVQEYLNIAKTAGDEKERRKALQFLMETIGDFSKRKEIDLEMDNKLSSMGPEEFLEYLENIPGVQVDEAKFVSGIFE